MLILEIKKEPQIQCEIDYEHAPSSSRLRRSSRSRSNFAKLSGNSSAIAAKSSNQPILSARSRHVASVRPRAQTSRIASSLQSIPNRRPTRSSFMTMRRAVGGTRYTRLLAGATVNDVPMNIFSSVLANTDDGQ